MFNRNARINTVPSSTDLKKDVNPAPFSWVCLSAVLQTSLQATTCHTWTTSKSYFGTVTRLSKQLRSQCWCRTTVVKIGSRIINGEEIRRVAIQAETAPQADNSQWQLTPTSIEASLTRIGLRHSTLTVLRLSNEREGPSLPTIMFGPIQALTLTVAMRVTRTQTQILSCVGLVRSRLTLIATLATY